MGHPVSNNRAVGGMLRHMAESDKDLIISDAVVESIKAELEKISPTRRQRILETVALAALGSIPWIGGVLSVAASYNFGGSDVRGDTLRDQWLEEHRQKLLKLRETLAQIAARLEGLGEEIDGRIESPEYLTLIRTTFRQWIKQRQTRNATCLFSSLRTQQEQESALMTF